MRAIHFLVAIFAFASAHATDWDELVQDRDTIAIVQQTLRAEGYDPGPINGELGPQTAAAVKQAQKDRELEPTGRLDRRTIAASASTPKAPPQAGRTASRKAANCAEVATSSSGRRRRAASSKAGR
jgi:peptidoglycan hydrolase-like protein with peptidoglycan-binding domain